MSQIHFSRSRAQSNGSSVNEEYVINQFLNGSSDYRLSVAIRYATSGITTTVPSYLGQSFNNTTSDASTAISRGEPSTTQVEVSNVRYKQHGLDIDFNFRASELSFRWPNFGALGSAYKRRTLRFYLQVTLVPTSSLPGRDPIYLLRTGWYKVKDIQKIYNTGSPSGIDAQIEAIPWVYEFNEKIKMSYVLTSTNNSELIGSPGFLRSPSRLFYLEKILHDRRRVKTIDYSNKVATYEEDAPSGYRGIFFRESDGAPQNSINDLPYIMCPSCEETALTFFARLLAFKGAIKPDAYGNPADDGQTIVDHPVLAWRDLTYLSRYGQYLSDWWAGGIYGLDDFNSILDSDSALISDCARNYRFKVYRCQTPQTQYYGRFIRYNVAISGWVDINSDLSVDIRENILSSSSPDDYAEGNDVMLAYNLNSGDALVYLQVSDADSIALSDYGPFQFNKDQISYYQTFSEPVFDSSEVQGISLELDSVLVSTSFVNMAVDDEQDIEREDVELDLGGLGYSSISIQRTNGYTYIVPEFSESSVMYKYSQFLRRIEFSAEWRPWITIYDVVRVTYKNDSGESATSFVFIQDIDANADTMSATYTGYILED